jgi:hypothetical protein
MQVITGGWWDVSDRTVTVCWKNSSIIFSSKVAESSLEAIGVSEAFWKGVFLKLHLTVNSVLTFEELHGVDSNFKINPLLMDIVILESVN